MWADATCSTAPTSAGSPSDLAPERVPRHVGVMLDGNRRWARARGAGTGEGHQAGADKIEHLLALVRGGRRRGVTLWLLSTDNLSRPAEGAASRCCSIIETAVADLADERPLAAAPRRGARPAAARRPPRRLKASADATRGGRRAARQRRRRLRRAPRDRRRRARRCSSSTPTRGTPHRAARRGPRRRAHRRAPLHQGPARPRPRHPHLGGAAARRLPALAERHSRSSTSARPTGPTSARSTSCARCAPIAERDRRFGPTGGPERCRGGAGPHPSRPSQRPQRRPVGRPNGRKTIGADTPMEPAAPVCYARMKKSVSSQRFSARPSDGALTSRRSDVASVRPGES